MLEIYGNTNWRQWHNTGASSVEAFGCFRITDNAVVEDDNVTEGEEPDGAAGLYAVNGPMDIAADGWGAYQTGNEVLVAYDTGTPAVGELWGPKSGQATLAKGATGTGGTGTTLRADWGVLVIGIVSADLKLMRAQVMPYGMSKRCKCQLAGAVVATDSTRTVDNVVATSLGWAPVANASDTITAHIQLNLSSSGGYAGADNTVAYIEFHEDDGYWWIYDMSCAA